MRLPAGSWNGFSNAGCLLTLLLIVEDRPKLIGIMEVILFQVFMGNEGLTSFLWEF
jgi:hypothetical protein